MRKKNGTARDRALIFDDFIRQRLLPALDTRIGAVGRALLTRAVLRELRYGQPPVIGYAPLAAHYAHLADLAGARLPDDVEGVQTADPVGRRLPVPTGATPEAALMQRGLAYLLETTSQGQRDELFAALFWQTVRVRGVLYRHVVQRPLTPGLQWFVRFYGRMSPAKQGATDGLFASAAARASGAGHGLRSLEVRTAPNERKDVLARLLRQVGSVAEGLADRDVPETGLVLHLTKDRGGQARQGAPKALGRGAEADPMRNPTRYRYATFYAKWKRSALALAGLIRTFPRTLRLVRGIDVCTDELGVPTWVLAPLFRYLREQSALTSAVLAPDAADSARPLRITAHVGEDYVHLLGGLRRVDDAIEHLGMEAGDRIGHGIALGTSPRVWAGTTGRLAVPREERLFDLVWEWSCNGRGAVDTGRAQLLEREIARLSQHVFEKRLTPPELEALIAALHTPQALRHVGFPDRPEAPDGGDDDTHRLLRRYLTTPTLYRRGQVLDWLDVGEEGEALHRLQVMLREKTASRSITVEVNPSSNLLIGNLGELQDHPLWRLRPPEAPDDGVPPVSVCIGSDDPLTFATTLPDEYQLLADTMSAAGLGEMQCRAWLREAVRAGMNARFTLQWRPGWAKEMFSPTARRPTPAPTPP